MDNAMECAVLEREEIAGRASANLEQALDENEGLLSPFTAAVELLHEFRLMASAMVPTDKSTQDDLVQEMALGALTANEPHPASYYLWLGACRAKDYLRWWIEPMRLRPNLTPAERKALKEQDEVLERADKAADERRIAHFEYAR
jgi:hypothetical protein